MPCNECAAVYLQSAEHRCNCMSIYPHYIGVDLFSFFCAIVSERERIHIQFKYINHEYALFYFSVDRPLFDWHFISIFLFYPIFIANVDSNAFVLCESIACLSLIVVYGLCSLFFFLYFDGSHDPLIHARYGSDDHFVEPLNQWLRSEDPLKKNKK